jgi:hypothetical protein
MKHLSFFLLLSMLSAVLSSSTPSSTAQTTLTYQQIRQMDDTFAQVSFGFSLFYAARGSMTEQEVQNAYAELMPFYQCMSANAGGLNSAGNANTNNNTAGNGASNTGTQY